MLTALRRFFQAKPRQPQPLPMVTVPLFDDGRRYVVELSAWGTRQTRRSVTAQQANDLIGLHNENIKRGQLWRLEITRIR